MEKKFCLLSENWILALDKRGKTVELPLLDAFRQARELKCLSGELPTQDAAVLRFLLAVVYAVFTRVDIARARGAVANRN